MALLMAERKTERPPLPLFGEQLDETLRPPGARGDAGGGPTLDDLVVGAWEGLTAHVAVACPLCEEGMLRPLAPRAGADVSAGRCDRCGATLA